MPRGSGTQHLCPRHRAQQCGHQRASPAPAPRGPRHPRKRRFFSLVFFGKNLNKLFSSNTSISARAVLERLPRSRATPPGCSNAASAFCSGAARVPRGKQRQNGLMLLLEPAFELAASGLRDAASARGGNGSRRLRERAQTELRRVGQFTRAAALGFCFVGTRNARAGRSCPAERLFVE